MNPTRRSLLTATALAGAGVALTACENLDGRCIPGPNPSPTTKRLPKWFEQNRTQAHTRLPVSSMLERDDVPHEAFTKYLAEDLDAEVYTRHVKSRDEDPWWPTKATSSDALSAGDARTNSWTGPARKRRTAQVPAGYNALEIIDHQSRRFGLSWIAYYTTEFDKRVAEAHPEWICRRPGGAPNNLAYRGRLGTVLDITSPYRDLVAERMAEVVRAGAKAIYIDRAIIPPWGDASHWGIRQYHAETGRVRSLDGDDGTLSTYSSWFSTRRYSAESLLWYRWKVRKVAETLAVWREAIHATNPDAVLIVSASNLPALIRPDASSLWCAEADSIKTETDLAIAPSRRNWVNRRLPNLPDPPKGSARALGWALTRDSADGRPFHVWSGAAIDTTEMALLWASAILAHGGIANLDIYEHSRGIVGAVPARDFTSAEAAGAIFKLGRKVSPYMAYTRPLRHAVVHIPERHRNTLLNRPEGVAEVARNVVLPCTGAFDVFASLGLSVGTLDDQELSRGVPSESHLLYLPTDEVTSRQRRSVQIFADNGGQVVRQADLAPWEQPLSQAPRRMQEIITTLDDLPVRVESQAKCHATAFRHIDDSAEGPLTRLVVMVVNRFDGLADTAPVAKGSSRSDAIPTAIKGANLRWHENILRHNVVAYEAVTGELLEITTRDGVATVRLPEFTTMACVVLAAC